MTTELTEKLKANQSGGDANAMLADIIRKDHEIWEKYPNLDGLPPNYGARVVKVYAEVIDQVETQVFDRIKLTARIRRDLRKTVSFMFEKEWFHPDDESGVVIAGMGDVEPFPALLYYRVGTVAAGKLRYVQAAESRVGSLSTAAVMPFAHRETIDMIISGIHPGLLEKLIEDIDHRIPAAGKTRKEAKRQKRATANGIDMRKQEFEKYIRDEMEEALRSAVRDSCICLATARPRQNGRSPR